MHIERINSYVDNRFPQRLLHQHGCFLADGLPCAFEIISASEAVMHYCGDGDVSLLIDEFRFYAGHITTIYGTTGQVLASFTPVAVFPIAVDSIQPSQFFVDRDKFAAVAQFVSAPSDIIVPVISSNSRYISADGHTRLYLAVQNGWKTVLAWADTPNAILLSFAQETIRRGVCTPGDMQLLEHEEYDVQWNKFCNDFLKQ